MIQKQNDEKRRIAQMVFVCLCVFVLASDVVLRMVKWEMREDYGALQRLICYCLLGTVISSLPKMRRETGFFLPAVYFFWLVISRLLLRCLTPSLQGEIYCAAAMCCAFYAPRMLDARRRKTLFNCFCWILFLILAAWSAFGMLIVIKVVPRVPIGDEAIHIMEELQDTGALRSLSFFSVHRNTSAAWLMAALWLAIVQILTTPRKWLRFLLGAFAALMYAAIAMQHCRSVCVAVSVGFGLLLILLVKDRIPIRRGAVRIACVGIVAAAVMLISYKGFGLCNTVADRVSVPAAVTQAVSDMKDSIRKAAKSSPEARSDIPGEPQQPAEAVQESPVQQAAPAEQQTRPEIPAEQQLVQEIPAEQQVVQEIPAEQPAVPETGVSDNRNFFRDLMTLTMRTEIWTASIKTILKNPMFMLLGQPEGAISENLRQFGGMTREVGHTHNTFLQILSLSGFVGLGIMASFVCLQVFSAVRIFWGKEPISRKILAILLICLLLYGMIEPLLSDKTLFSSLCFMLAAGMLAQD